MRAILAIQLLTSLWQANILIDNARTAVLCDFGLSRVKADMTSRTSARDVFIGAGSRNWMSPERFRGQTTKKPCDVYSFGLTIYEVRYSCTALI